MQETTDQRRNYSYASANGFAVQSVYPLKGVGDLIPIIVDRPKTILLHGVVKVHEEAKSYGQELMELLDIVWAEVRRNELPHKGINHVVYEGDSIFAGIELITPIADELQSKLIRKEYVFPRYAYWKHIGPYSELPDVHRDIRSALEISGHAVTNLNMEIYGHWNEDPAKLETEIMIGL